MKNFENKIDHIFLDKETIVLMLNWLHKPSSLLICDRRGHFFLSYSFLVNHGTFVRNNAVDGIRIDAISEKAIQL